MCVCVCVFVLLSTPFFKKKLLFAANHNGSQVTRSVLLADRGFAP